MSKREEEYKKGYELFCSLFENKSPKEIIKKLKDIPTVYSHSKATKEIIDNSGNVEIKYFNSKENKCYELHEIKILGYGCLTINMLGIMFNEHHRVDKSYIYKFCNF